MTRRLTKFGEPVLKKKAAEVEVFDESLKELASDLVDTLYEENGLGLAANRLLKADIRNRYAKEERRFRAVRIYNRREIAAA